MINEALTYYDFDNPDVELIRHNENMTYKVTYQNETYVLRIHSSVEGFENVDMPRSLALITDETTLLRSLESNGNMHTQQVKLNNCGNPVTVLDNGIPVTVLSWVEGETLDNVEVTADIAHMLGEMIGRLHNELAKVSFENRYQYDSMRLSHMIQEVNSATVQGCFSAHHSAIIVNTLANIGNYLSRSANRFMPVHADMGRSNLIYHDGLVVPIDFSLFGYCVPDMDLAGVFSDFDDEVLQAEIMRGYKSVCEIKVDDEGIEMCFSLQILLFVVGQHSRFAHEAWFSERLDYWCARYFGPLNAKCKRS